MGNSVPRGVEPPWAEEGEVLGKEVGLLPYMLGTYGIGSIGHPVYSGDKRLIQASVEGVEKPMEDTLEHFWVETRVKVGGLL